MANDIQKSIIRMRLIVDFVLILVSYFGAWMLRFRTTLFGEAVRVLSFEYYMRYLFILIPLMLILNYAFGLYTYQRIHGRRSEAANILKANTCAVLVLILFLYIIKQVHFARIVLVLFYVINILLSIIARNWMHSMQKKLFSSGFNKKSIILIGYSDSAEQFIDRVKAFPDWGYEIIGILDNQNDPGPIYKDIKILGKIDSLPFLLEANHVDEIAITLGLSQYYRLESIVSICEKSGVHTKFIPDYYNIIPTKPYTEDLAGLPVINIRYVPLNNPFSATIKRAMDIVGSLMCLVLFSPVMLFAVIGIKATSPGPLIFKQIRVGLHNKEFEMYKFRSMAVQTKEEEHGKWTVKNDPRVTPFGKFIRKTSIDELPQIINVLKGDMSLIGPRPERPQFVEKFRETIPRYMIKHQVRPGMTGWAQVNGYRGDTSIKKRIEHDLYYIENWTVGFDIKILFYTVFKGFVNKNAY